MMMLLWKVYTYKGCQEYDGILCGRESNLCGHDVVHGLGRHGEATKRRPTQVGNVAKIFNHQRENQTEPAIIHKVHYYKDKSKACARVSSL